MKAPWEPKKQLPAAQLRQLQRLSCLTTAARVPRRARRALRRPALRAAAAKHTQPFSADEILLWTWERVRSFFCFWIATKTPVAICAVAI